jgi:hypothetical protein
MEFAVSISNVLGTPKGCFDWSAPKIILNLYKTKDVTYGLPPVAAREKPPPDF